MNERERINQQPPEQPSTERHSEVPHTAEHTGERAEFGEGEGMEAADQPNEDLAKAREALSVAAVKRQTDIQPRAQNNRTYKSKSISFEVSREAVDDFLTSQGLSESDITDLKIEFVDLKKGGRFDSLTASFSRDFVAKYLSGKIFGRIGEIFTRVESLSYSTNTLRIFVNNLDEIYSEKDNGLLVRDTIHHLVHYAQIKRGELSKLAWVLSRLPIVHERSASERQARKIAAENADDPRWQKLVQLNRIGESKPKYDKPELKINPD